MAETKVVRETTVIGPYTLVSEVTYVEQTSARGKLYSAAISVTATGRKVLELEGTDIVSMYGENECGYTVPTIVKDAATGEYHAEVP